MIVVNFSGLMGNNLFQYSAGRLIAEALGYELKCAGIYSFPHTFDIVRGMRFIEPVETISDENFALRTTVNDRRNRRIELNGHFQRADFLVDNKSRVLDFFCQPKLETFPALDIVIHVRLGDYVTLDWSLPYSYFEVALTRLYKKEMEIWIATDEPWHPFFLRFKKWKPRYIKADSYDTFLLMRKAKNLIISRSTFSWWAAFLGDHDAVIGPKPKSGFWSNHTIGLGMSNLFNDRVFTPIEYDETETQNFIERFYFNLRESNSWLKMRTKNMRKFVKSYVKS